MNSYVGLMLAVTALTATVNGLQLSVSPTKVQYLETDARLELQCEIDEGLLFIIKGKMRWFFKASDTAPDVQITDQGTIIVSDPNYEFTFDTDANLNARLTILSVSDASNGEYICRIENDGVNKEGSVKIVIQKPVTRVELSIENGNPIIGIENNPWEEEVKLGKSSIMCTAHGSYPQAKVLAYIGNTPIPPESFVNIEENQSPTYKSSITVHRRLLPTDNGKRLRCVANLDLPSDVTNNNPDVETSIPLHIITLVPLITCSNKTASILDKYVTLTCDVSSQKPIRKLYWKLGYNNQIIYPGNKTKDMTEVRIEKVEGDNENQKVILDIYKMKKEHFNSIFYLIVESSDGAIYQEPVYIRQNTSGSSGIRSVEAMIVFSFLLGFISKWIC